jgi:DNA-directed RNA polymerase specialized sigma24 family protein
MPARSTTAPPLALAAEPGAAEGPIHSDRTRRLRGLIDDSFDLVARVVRNLGVPPGEVDDVLQRVFSSAADRLADIAPGSERAFLVQVAVRWAANARRARARLREVGYDDLPEAPTRRLRPRT